MYFGGFDGGVVRVFKFIEIDGEIDFGVVETCAAFPGELVAKDGVGAVYIGKYGINSGPFLHVRVE